MNFTKNDIAIKKKIETAELVKISRMKPAIRPTKPHKHDGYYEIIYLYAGKGYHTIELDCHKINPPVVFLLKPGQVHCWEFTDIPDGHVLMFQPDFLNEYLHRNSTDSWVCGCLELDEQNISAIETILKSITQEYENRKENFEKAIASYLNVLLIEIARITAENQQNLEIQKKEDKFRCFVELVERQYKEKRQVKEYADQLHISAKHLNTICKKNEYKTASAIINDCINTEAKRLLIHTDNSISEIAFELGFNDSSHFAKFFRNLNNSSPKKFRSKRFQ